MTQLQEVNSKLNRPGFSRKQVQPIAMENLVKCRLMFEDKPLPLLIEPNVEGVSLTEWTKGHWDLINEYLYKYGAIVFRGFDLETDEKFVSYVDSCPVELIPYLERSSPRKSIAKNIFTSTLYPDEETIALHNENTASLMFALKVWFYCAEEPIEGGETPVADSRKILDRIDPEVLDKFRKLGWTLTRNFANNLGYDWKGAFAGMSRPEVEDYCNENHIEFKWKSDNHLWTRQKIESTLIHPVTGEESWFNHIAFWHRANLPPEVLESMLSEVGDDNLPFDTLYGDGTRIPDEIGRHLRDAYLQEKVKFKWQQGDLMLIDNVLASHGRERFTGPRKVRVAMAEGFTRPPFK